MNTIILFTSYNETFVLLGKTFINWTNFTQEYTLLSYAIFREAGGFSVLLEGKKMCFRACVTFEGRTRIQVEQNFKTSTQHLLLTNI
jgi:hypothetical protein